MEVLFLDGGPLLEDFKSYCHIRNYWLKKKLLFLKIKQHLIGYPFLFGLYEKKYDLIYANSVGTLSIATKLKKYWNKPLVLHLHEAECLLNTSPNKVHIPEVDTFLTVSNLAAKNLKKHYGILPEKIHIQHPISPWVEKYWKGEVSIEPNHLSLYQGKVVIGLLTNGSYTKWNKSTDLIPLLIHQFYKLHPNANCQFLYVGFLNDQDNYMMEHELKRLGVDNKVTLVGQVSNPLDHLSAFDILLLASREESYSLTAMEAATAGVPIVYFEGCTGAEEWIGEEAGVKVPYMDLEALSNTLYNLSNDKSLRLSLGKRGRQLSKSLHDQDSKMEGLTAILQSYTKNKH